MKKSLKKKIIISSYDDLKNPVYAGGGAVEVSATASGLAKDFDVTVLTGKYKHSKNETIKGVKYIRIGSDIFGHKIGQIIFQNEILRYALKLEHDAWIESSTLPFTFSLLPLFTKKPVIAWVNMLCSQDMQRKYKLNFAPVERELSKLYKYAVVPTDWVKNKVVNMNRRIKMVKIPPGFDLRKLKTKSKKKKAFSEDYVLFIGRIEIDQKGLDLLLNSAEYIKGSCKIILAGRGSMGEEAKLRELLKKPGLKNQVVRVGRIKGREKAELIANAAAVVVPSRFETFSLSALEAIAYGKRVICFDIPQLEWIAKKFVYKARAFDAQSLGEAINKAGKNKGRGNIAQSEARKFLDNFERAKTVGDFRNFILQTII